MSEQHMALTATKTAADDEVTIEDLSRAVENLEMDVAGVESEVRRIWLEIDNKLEAMMVLLREVLKVDDDGALDRSHR
jgi:hypothetical protein